MRASLQQAAHTLQTARHIVVFTGAGMSAESNIPTFRDDDGFWQRFPVESFATWSGIARTALRQPRALAEFAYEVIHPIADATPNPGHLAIEQLEHHTKVTVVTQNIDGLHQLAGNTVIHEIHGSLFEVVSWQGRFRKLLSRGDLQQISRRVAKCRQGPFSLARLLWALRPWLGLGIRGLHRPKLVLFGDAMAEPDWSLAYRSVAECDCLLQIGCSGLVMPAATLPSEAKAAGATTIAIDPQPAAADLWLPGTAAEIMPALVQAISQ
jgi:NAD-dependent deacetylase